MLLLVHEPDFISQQFYHDRMGYVEIVRTKRLERVYYQVPEVCVDGGPLNNPTGTCVLLNCILGFFHLSSYLLAFSVSIQPHRLFWTQILCAVLKFCLKTDRIDLDKKNKEFIDNMCEVVAKEEFHDKIRKSDYAFTVTKLASVRKVSDASKLS